MIQDANDLNIAVRDPGPRTIQISGRIDLGSITLQIASDKTLVGINGGAEILGTVRVYNARNVILENIKFNGISPTAGDASTLSQVDALEITGSTCVWIDHCEFFDGIDDNLDIVRGSDLVTVSWSKFYYVAKTDDHRLASVCGNTDADTPGKINVTFHHNWWGDKVIEEMPRVRHGKVHIFNNYYSAVDNNYCIGAGYLSKLYVENNFFDGVNDPIVYQADEGDSGVHTAEIVEMGNDTATATGGPPPPPGGLSFQPRSYYPYTADSAAAAKAAVMATAGVH